MEYIQSKEEFLNYIYQSCHCINAGQSKEERRTKYQLARYLGASKSHADRLRDWRTTNFAKYFGYESWQSLMNHLSKGVK